MFELFNHDARIPFVRYGRFTVAVSFVLMLVSIFLLFRPGFELGLGFHHMCTTRMATDPAEGVVDADLRVHSVDNLYVAGSSSFGTAGAATVPCA